MKCQKWCCSLINSKHILHRRKVLQINDYKWTLVIWNVAKKIHLIGFLNERESWVDVIKEKVELMHWKKNMLKGKHASWFSNHLNVFLFCNLYSPDTKMRWWIKRKIQNKNPMHYFKWISQHEFFVFVGSRDQVLHHLRQ